MKKHIAQNVDTGSRYVVVLLQIPQRPDHALVIQTDGLPPRFEQTVMQILESQEGQAETDLANALARRMYEDTGRTVLATLHERGLLNPVHIDKVTMIPHPAYPISLRTVLTEMGRTIPGVAEKQVTEKFNPITNNMAAATFEERVMTARNLLLQADDLQRVADKKREEAYRYAPELRPVTAVDVEPEPAPAFALTVEDNVLTEVQAVTPGSAKAAQAEANGKPVLTAEQFADIFEGRATLEQFQQAPAPVETPAAPAASGQPQLTAEQIADLFEGKITIEQIRAQQAPAGEATEAAKKPRTRKAKAG